MRAAPQVYYRGVGVAREEGVYGPEKLDLLLRMLLLEPAGRLLQALSAGRLGAAWAGGAGVVARAGDPGNSLRGLLSREGPGPQTSRDRAPAHGPLQSPPSTSASAGSALADAGGGGRPLLPLAGGGRAAGGEAVREPVSPKRSSRRIERRTLRRLFPTARALLANLFRRVELQEPVLRQVVLLYRRAPLPPLHGPVAASAAADAAAEARRIHVRSFGDVPLADVEVTPLLLVALVVCWLR